jgi:hypothetical protein
VSRAPSVLCVSGGLVPQLVNSSLSNERVIMSQQQQQQGRVFTPRTHTMDATDGTGVGVAEVPKGTGIQGGLHRSAELAALRWRGEARCGCVWTGGGGDAAHRGCLWLRLGGTRGVWRSATVASIGMRCVGVSLSLPAPRFLSSHPPSPLQRGASPSQHHIPARLCVWSRGVCVFGCHSCPPHVPER